MGNQDDQLGDFRSGKRLKAPLHIHYGPYQNVVVSGHCADISAGGLYLRTELPLSVNEHVALIFHLPNRKDPITCNAKVVWTNPAICARKPDLPPGAGLEFIDLTTEEATSIVNFIESMNKAP